MVDWATAAVSGGASSVGVLVTVLLERRQELVRRLDQMDAQAQSLDQRLRAMEAEQVELRPGSRFFNDLSAKGLMSLLGKGGRR